MPILACLSAGASLTAVARHGHEVALRLERRHDVDLLLWRHSGVDLGVAHGCLARRRGQLSKCRAGQRTLVIAHDAQLASDRRCGCRMIAGHHGNGNPGRTAECERLVSAPGRGRVCERHQAEKHEIALDRGRRQRLRQRIQGTLGIGQDPIAGIGGGLRRT